MSVNLDAVHAGLRPPARTIRLVVSDLDGTLFTAAKAITPAVRAMVQRLLARGVPLCLASARPPEAVMPVVRTLGLNGPSAAFNGGYIFQPDGAVAVHHVLSARALGVAFDMLHVHGVEIWFLRASEWLVADASTGFVALERRMTGLSPVEVDDLRSQMAGIGKVVGVTTSPDLLRRMETELGVLLKGEACVRRSSDTMLDITPVLANKGEGLRQIARFCNVSPDEVACLGDAPNDLSMFEAAGLSIAMGQADDAVAAAAHFRTDTNERDGWAKAVEHIILPRVPQS